MNDCQANVLPHNDPLAGMLRGVATLNDATAQYFDAKRDTRDRLGHSAGGQFVHRMVSFGFRNRVAVAVSANAGTSMRCRSGDALAIRPGETDVDTDALRALLGFRITVMAGTGDVSTTGRFFPKGSRSMRQGQPAMSAHNCVQSGHANGGGAADQLCLGCNRRARRGP